MPRFVPVSHEEATALVGLEESAAVELAETEGWSVRVAERDGQGRPMTRDLRPDRVNVSIVDGVVSADLLDRLSGACERAPSRS